MLIVKFPFEFSEGMSVEELRLGRKNKKQKKHRNNDDELPGTADPDTIFVPSELGNFEPRSEQLRPGIYGIRFVVQSVYCLYYFMIFFLALWKRGVNFLYFYFNLLIFCL